MITKVMPTSGISKTNVIIPKIFPYPKLLNIDSLPNVHNILCYVIKGYNLNGLSVLVYRQPKDDQIVVICGDWNGKSIDLRIESELSKIANEFIVNDLDIFIKTMFFIKLSQAQFFFSIDDNNELILVDIQIAINKLSGPGMIRDVFGNAYKTQEITAIEIIDDRATEYIKLGSGSYQGDLIIKPSKYRMYNDPQTDAYSPLYVGINR